MKKNTAIGAAIVLTVAVGGLGAREAVKHKHTPAPVSIEQTGPIVVVSSKVLADAGAVAAVDAGKAPPADAGTLAPADAGSATKSVPGKK